MAALDRAEIGRVKRRMEAVFLLFLAVVIAISGRLAYLQVFRTREFAERADRMTTRTFQIDAKRGSITDRNGYGLAEDVLAKGIAINPRVVADPAATADRLAELVHLTEKERDQVEEIIQRGKQKRTFYTRLMRGVDRKLAVAALKASHKDPLLKTLTLEDTPRRVNPGGLDGRQLIGEVNIDGKGIEGFELSMNSVLGGANGERRVRVNANGDPIPESETKLIPPRDGKDIKLTIDRDIQHMIEGHVRQLAKERQPDAASIIVMDVKTGEILGMTNYPNFIPGAKKTSNAQRRNRAITDLFEPGSIFKVLTAAAALEYGVNTNAYCSGKRTIGKWTIGCAHGAHGSVDLGRIIEVSCNLGAGALAERVGAKRLYHFLGEMGLQTKTGIEFPGEEHGIMKRPEEWKTLRTVNIGFGQGVVVTPIQLLAAYAAIANDGVYNPPKLILDAPGGKSDARKPHRVMQAEKARILRRAMERVVTGQSGTGKKAKIPGFSVAGKTGTAQIAKNGHYGNGFVASFVGFVPVEKPRVAILVSVWHPRVGHFGGDVSAPVFREVARDCVEYMRLPPDQPDDKRDGAKLQTMAKHGGAPAAGAHHDD